MDTIHQYRFQLIYSVVLIILIPACLIFNTVWLIQGVRQVTDTELQRKAMLLADASSVSIVDNLSDPAKVQQTIVNLTKLQPQIKEYTVYVLEDDAFKPIASSDTGKLNQRLTDPSTVFAWSQDRATAIQENITSSEGHERVWSVVTPVHDASGKKVALIDSKLSVADIDALTTATFHQSFLVLLGAIIIILLLLINHFRLIESATLLRKLKEVDSMKDDFISIASHELRTPVTAIKGYASMLLEGRGGPLDETGQRYVVTMMNSTKNLEALVADMLDVTRIEQGKLDFVMKSLNLVESCNEVVENLIPTAMIKGLQIVHNQPEQPVQIQADPQRMRQVLFNILGNAVKYTQKGSITISYKVERNSATMIIRDTGIGMSAQARERLFDKFYRIQTTETEKIAGTGLGLWITRQLVEKMKGHIYVDSIEGEGSQFSLQFPLTKGS